MNENNGKKIYKVVYYGTTWVFFKMKEEGTI